MRVIPVLVLVVSLTALLASSASALDLCEEPQCQPHQAEQNSPYEFAFEAEEGCVPYRFTYLNGTLPAGIRIAPEGKLVGTPTDAGNFDFWVALNDSSGPSNPACPDISPQSQAHIFMHVLPDLAVTTASLPAAAPGQPYSVQLQFSNPESGWPVIWDITAGTLPQGLTLSESGVISGTPTGTDVKQFVVRAREPFRRFGERQLTLTVATALQAKSAARAGEVGVRYRGSIPASGGAQPLTWSVADGALPAGLSLNTTTGALSGVPRRAGAFAVTFAVRDSVGQTATVPANIRIVARLAIATKQLARAETGTSYAARLETRGGLSPVRWTVVNGALPAGVRLDARTGRLLGTPRRAGTYQFTVQAVDRIGGKSTKRYRITVVN